MLNSQSPSPLSQDSQNLSHSIHRNFWCPPIRGSHPTDFPCWSISFTLHHFSPNRGTLFGHHLSCVWYDMSDSELCVHFFLYVLFQYDSPELLSSYYPYSMLALGVKQRLKACHVVSLPCTKSLPPSQHNPGTCHIPQRTFKTKKLAKVQGACIVNHYNAESHYVAFCDSFFFVQLLDHVLEWAICKRQSALTHCWSLKKSKLRINSTVQCES